MFLVLLIQEKSMEATVVLPDLCTILGFEHPHLSPYRRNIKLKKAGLQSFGYKSLGLCLRAHICECTTQLLSILALLAKKEFRSSALYAYMETEGCGDCRSLIPDFMTH